MSDKSEALLCNSRILSDRLVSRISLFSDYEESEKIRMVVLGSEDVLKSKSCSAFANENSIAVEGFSTASLDIDLYDLIFSDCLLIHTTAIRMAPLKLVNALNLLKRFNKVAYIAVDKWNMLPQTKDNIEKVHNGAIKEFSMLNIVSVYNIGDETKGDYISFEDMIAKVVANIEDRRESVRNQQVERVYQFLVDEVEKECLETKARANGIRETVEQCIINVNGFHKANTVKVKNASAEFNLYSLELFNKWKIISVEECIGEVECNENEELRSHVRNEYVKYVMAAYSELTNTIIANYKERIKTIRENLLNEMYLVRDTIVELQYIDNTLEEQFNTSIEELESVDSILKSIIELIELNTKGLEKKVNVITNSIFDEETLGNKLGSLVKDILKNADDDEEITDIKNKIMIEKAVRKYYRDVINKCNIQIFAEVDKFVEELKKSVNKKSERILDVYYKKAEKDLLEIETKIAKDYIVV